MMFRGACSARIPLTVCLLGVLLALPAAAQTTLDVTDTGVGIGTETPLTLLHLRSEAATAKLLVEEADPLPLNRTLFHLRNNGFVQFFFEDTASGSLFQMSNFGTLFQISSASTGLGKFRVRDVGGLLALTGTNVIFDLTPEGNLTIDGVLSEGSSREVKHAFQPVDGRAVLDKVAALPITVWSYEHDSPAIRHLGPMGEDFHDAFELGGGERHIAALDTAGVALAAIQGLNEKVETLEAQRAALESELAELKRLVGALAACREE